MEKGKTPKKPTKPIKPSKTKAVSKAASKTVIKAKPVAKLPAKPKGTRKATPKLAPLKKPEWTTADLKVLYEDTDIAAIYKPAGIVVHPDEKDTHEVTLADLVAKKWPQTKKTAKQPGVGEPITLNDGSTIERPGIVHRLDKETSGVLLIAKTQAGFNHLKQQFQNHEIRKAYRAFIYGDLTDGRGTIDLPIGRSKHDPRKRSAGRGAAGELRPATTSYTVLAHTKDVSYIEARPLTGRTHQIRVHFKAIQKPVVGDRLYAEGMPSLLGFNRVALHAVRITFRAMNGQEVRVEAPLPEDFVKAEGMIGYTGGAVKV